MVDKADLKITLGLYPVSNVVTIGEREPKAPDMEKKMENNLDLENLLETIRELYKENSSEPEHFNIYWEYLNEEKRLVVQEVDWIDGKYTVTTTRH